MKKYKNITIVGFLLFSLFVMTLTLYHIKEHKNENIELFTSMLEEKAASYYNILMLTREWLSKHDGKVFIKSHDFSLNNDSKLVNINPKLLTEELATLSKENNNDVFFEIVGIDSKESLKKKSFENSSLAYLANNPNSSSFTQIREDEKLFCFMGVLRVENSCFSCHDSTSSSVGDVLGGLKITMPIDGYLTYKQNLEDKTLFFEILVFFGTIFVILIVVWLIDKIFSHQEKIENNLLEIGQLESSNQTILRRYKYALDGSQYGIWDWDLVNNSIYFDSNWKKILGYQANEIKNDFKEWEKRVHPDDLKDAFVDIEKNTKGKTEYYKNIHRLKHKDGSWVWILDKGKTYFDEAGKAIRMVGFHTDITELKRMEIKLKESEQNLLLSQKIAGMGYWKWNLRSNNFFISESLSALISKEDSDILTYEEYRVFVDKADIKSFEKHHRKVLVSKNKDFHYYKLHTKEKTFEIEEYLQYIYDDLTDEEFLIGTVYDLSDRIKMENELLQKDELMLHQSKNAAMGEMISMIAHQWRQPITAISMSANNLIADAQLDLYDKDETEKIAQNIALQTQYLSKTIDDFRNFFMEDKRSEYTNFGKLFEETCSIIMGSLKNNSIELVLDFDKEITIKTYTRELLQVILNILKNAKEAFLDKDIEKKTIKVNVEEKGDDVVLIIEDNAGGIAQDKMANIFDAYFTTKQEHNGTGLGLYMSQTIVSKHLKGSIKAYNSKQGAIFEITLKKFLE